MITLYYARGACSLAPHIALEELEIPFEAIPISFGEDEQSKPPFLEINPRGRVPTIQMDGENYTEAAALLIFLASKKPSASLLPAYGSAKFARCLEWLVWISSTLHGAVAQEFRPYRYIPKGEDAAAFRAQGRCNIREMSAEVEARIGDGWLLGESYSVADIYLFPFFRFAALIGEPMSDRYPKWTGWFDRMTERPAVRRATEREGIAL